MKLRSVVSALWLALLCPGTLAWGQWPRSEADGYRLSVASERDSVPYACGEEVRFVVTLSQDGAPVREAEIEWRVTKDTWTPKKEGTLSLREGRALLAGGSIADPGFLQCAVRYTTPAGEAVEAMAGAAVDPLRIEASMPEPKDFLVYWMREKKKQARIPLNVRVTPLDYQADTTVAVFDVQADCLPGAFSASYAYPKGAEKGSLPALVTLNGAGVKSSRTVWTVHWAHDGLCVLDFNVHGLPNNEPESYYRDLENGELHNYYLTGRDDRDAMFFHDMVMRLLRALDVITSMPQWDGRTLFVQGCSQGGAQAIMAGCLDSRVDLVCAEIPAMSDHTGMTVDRTSSGPHWVQCPDGEPDARQLEAARYYDVVNFARHVKAPTYVTVGMIDSVCPPTTVYSMYNRLPCEKHILRLPMGHIQSGEGEENSRRAMKAYLNRLREEE